ncbi:MAG: YbaB/EbfC family nucleoid-associated protein [Acidimicrobiales bacterium]
MTDEPVVPDSISHGLAGLGGDDAAMPDLGGLLDSFQKVQEARAQVYEGVAGGGVVKVRASGDMTFEAVEISKDVVDPDDVGMLNDLVLAALHDLAARMLEAQHEAMGALGGLDIGGLLGGGADPG